MNIKTKIERLDDQGRGISYLNDKITFVPNTLENEIVTIADIEEHSKYNEAKLVAIEESNPNRIIPKCPFYKECGGCNLMHMNYDYQVEYKLNKVKNILSKFAKIDYDVKLIQNNSEIYYRNKISLKIENYEWGYYNNSTHNFTKIDNCLLAKNSINEIIKHKDLFKIKNGSIVIRTNYQDEILLNFQGEQLTFDKEKILSNIVGIIHNDKVLYGESFFYDYIGNIKFKLSYSAFFQVNNYIASNIFQILNNNLKGDKLLDLYCGVGTLGLSLADKFNEIYGIEINENAIEDAKYNAKINNVENAHYYAGDTYKILKDINVNFDSVIVDPPRSGLNKGTLDLLLNLKPNTIAYVSCDPLTLARDLNILKNNYDIKKMNALDMFPNTFHVETVCVLERR